MSSLAELISNNFTDHAVTIPALTAGMKVFQKPNHVFVDSGLPCDTFNVVHIINGQSITISELEETLDYFKSKNLAFCIWATEENLTPAFSALKLDEQNSEMGMFLNLAGYQPVANELHKNIREVGSKTELQQFANVIAENWTPPDRNVNSYYNMVEGEILNPVNKIILANYYVDGRAVGVVEMFPSDDETVGIYGLATLADYRGKRIGSALMSYCLKKAKDIGYKNVVLQASDDGIGIYTRFGFKSVIRFFEFA